MGAAWGPHGTNAGLANGPHAAPMPMALPACTRMLTHCGIRRPRDTRSFCLTQQHKGRRTVIHHACPYTVIRHAWWRNPNHGVDGLRLAWHEGYEANALNLYLARHEGYEADIFNPYETHGGVIQAMVWMACA